MATSHTVHLIDASPYIFRGYFSLPDTMEDLEGNPTNASYGFASFLVKYLSDHEPTHVGLAFDESLTTSFRNEIYPAYKAQRELPPAELEAQLADCQEVARALGLATFADERFEADDLIGTLSYQLVRAGHRVLVVTSDKDLAQLVGEHVALFDMARDKRYEADQVVEKFGVRPEQIADYLGLAGDSVDNIPGVRGVGAKTAVALLANYSGLDELYTGLEEVATLPIRGAKSVAKRLAEQRDTAFLSRRLATIALDAPVKARLSELCWNGAEARLVDPLFERLDFSGIKARVPRWKGR